MITHSIIISYSRGDEQWKDRLLPHFEGRQIKAIPLSAPGDERVSAGIDRRAALEKGLIDAEAAVLLVSADYLTSGYTLNIEIPRLLAKRAKEGLPIFPLIVSACPWQTVDWLQKMRVYPNNGEPLSAGTEYEIEEVLEDLAETVHLRLKHGVASHRLHPDEAISLSRLPVTDAAVFGRETEVALLDEAWKDGHTNVVTLIAWGGVGKTALVNHWLNGMAKDDFRGAEKVYGWSFYSQGAAEGKQASADVFMQETLRWFGDPDPTVGAPEEKGRRLADLIRKSKTLLVLDGIEPLQHPPGKDQSGPGRLKDPGLRALLKELAVSQPGLCVITSRERVTDLSVYMEPTVEALYLEDLSLPAGAELLKHLGIHGSEPEITEVVKEYGGHALTLTLLGGYLSAVYKGDIRQKDRIPAFTKEPSWRGHVKRMMQAYCHWLGKSAELDILYIMALFDRPVEEAAVGVLKSAPAIPGLTERLVYLPAADWQYALGNLRGLGLLAKEDARKAGWLDCHLLVREYFAERLKEENPDGWKEAHTRLYEYYRKLPKKELPDTLEEMSPLFSAVAHGCLAGRCQEAMDEVYLKRIRRGNEAFIDHKLGTFGVDLSVLSHFFDVPWVNPASGLKEDTKAAVLGWSAFGLRAVGRLREAVQPMKVSVEMSVEQEDWENAAVAASNLSELLLTLGDVSGAVAAARECVTHADRSGDVFMKKNMRTSLADALLQSGQFEEAEEFFREAEEMQQMSQPGFNFLYPLPGFKFYDLLLELGKDREVMERAEKGLEISKRKKWLLAIALDNLTLGRAWLECARKDHAGAPHAEPWICAKQFLDRAVAGLREAGTQDHLPRGLLARAACSRWRGDFVNAWTDLSEALEIAESGDMKLFICDYHLEAARLCTAEGKQNDASEHYRIAAELIEETGYYRRKKELP